MAIVSFRPEVQPSGQLIRLIKNQAVRQARPCVWHLSSVRRDRAVSPARTQCRAFSTTPVTHLQYFAPPRDTAHIKITPPAWPHPGYTKEEMEAVVPAHRPPRTLGDKAAWKTVRFARYWMDKVTGMDRDQKGDKSRPTTSVEAQKPLTEAQWVSRRHSKAVCLHTPRDDI